MPDGGKKSNMASYDVTTDLFNYQLIGIVLVSYNATFGLDDL